MFRMTDEKGGDDKILCMPAGDLRQEHLRNLHHLPSFDRLEIEHFFKLGFLPRGERGCVEHGIRLCRVPARHTGLLCHYTDGRKPTRCVSGEYGGKFAPILST